MNRQKLYWMTASAAIVMSLWTSTSQGQEPMPVRIDFRIPQELRREFGNPEMVEQSIGKKIVPIFNKNDYREFFPWAFLPPTAADKAMTLHIELQHQGSIWVLRVWVANCNGGILPDREDLDAIVLPAGQWELKGPPVRELVEEDPIVRWFERHFLMDGNSPKLHKLLKAIPIAKGAPLVSGANGPHGVVYLEFGRFKHLRDSIFRSECEDQNGRVLRMVSVGAGRETYSHAGNTAEGIGVDHTSRMPDNKPVRREDLSGYSRALYFLKEYRYVFPGNALMQ